MAQRARTLVAGVGAAVALLLLYATASLTLSVALSHAVDPAGTAPMSAAGLAASHRVTVTAAAEALVEEAALRAGETSADQTMAEEEEKEEEEEALLGPQPPSPIDEGADPRAPHIVQPRGAYLTERLRHYCAYPPFPARDEGTAPAPGAVLEQVHVLVRHGDRSAIHTIPNTHKAAWPCTAPSHAEVRWATSALQPFRSSAECIMAGGDACGRIAGAPLAKAVDRALFAWGRARSSGETCGEEGGDLSSVGWSQLLRIGKGLRRRYAELLARNDEATEALRFVSTDFGRTALSATALLRGLLNHSDVDHHADGPTLFPQLALPLRLHIVPTREDVLIGMKHSGTCSRATRLQKQGIGEMFAYARLPDDVAARIATVAGIDASQVPGTEEVADAVLARACHGYGLPCRDAAGGVLAEDRRDPDEFGSAKPGQLATNRKLLERSKRQARETGDAAQAPAACLPEEDVETIVKRGDALYDTRFDNNVTRILVYPFASQLVEMLQNAAAGAAGRPRMVVRAAHDTVVRPVMAALGVKGAPYPWPGYAARVAFELWRMPGSVGGHAGSSDKGTGNNVDFVVKLVYNGEDLTASMPCAARHGDEDAGAARPPAATCTLRSFSEQVAGLIAPAATFADACKD